MLTSLGIFMGEIETGNNAFSMQVSKNFTMPSIFAARPTYQVCELKSTSFLSLSYMLNTHSFQDVVPIAD